MRHALKLHPDYVCPAVTRIDVDVARPRPGTLTLNYIVTGAVADLEIPRATAPSRSDGLWKHSCFELFIRTAPGAAYHEFNFAPSTQWAAYRFASHRSGMSDVAEFDAPPIEMRSTGACYALATTLQLDRLPDRPTHAAWTLGLSAVIEEAGGRKSYWALEHPAGGADFHHSDCFALEVAAPEPA